MTVKMVSATRIRVDAGYKYHSCGSATDNDDLFHVILAVLAIQERFLSGHGGGNCSLIESLWDEKNNEMNRIDLKSVRRSRGQDGDTSNTYLIKDVEDVMTRRL